MKMIVYYRARVEWSFFSVILFDLGINFVYDSVLFKITVIFVAPPIRAVVSMFYNMDFYQRIKKYFSF